MASPAGIVAKEIRVTTHALCSPAVVGSHNTIIVNCTNPEMEDKYRNLPDLKEYNSNIRALKKLRGVAKDMETQLRNIREDSRSTNKSIAELRITLHQTEAQFEGLWQQHRDQRSVLASVLASLPDFISNNISSTVPAISASVAQAVYEQHFQIFSQSLYYDIDKILNSNQDELDELKKRVDALQYDVSFLMNEYLNGRLKENIGFYGISTGGAYLASGWQSRMAMEYEMLMPILNSPISWFAEIAKLNWNESRSYQTLPGLEPIEIHDDKKITIFSLGIRCYFIKWGEDLQSFFGSGLGHTISGEEDSFNVSVAVGTEYFRKNTRIALQLSIDYFSGINREKKEFNPLGNYKENTVSERDYGWYVGIKVAFR